MVKPNTLFWPAGRSGVSITMVPLSHVQESPELTVCAVVVCGKHMHRVVPIHKLIINDLKVLILFEFKD